MVRQYPFNFLAEIHPEYKEDLRKSLQDVNDSLTNNSLLNFSQLSSLHFGRMLVLDEVKKKDKVIYPAYLVLSTNYDGDLDLHLKEFINATNFDALFKYCKNFPGSNASLSARINFLKEHANYKAYFYRGTWGRSVEQICFEEEARKAAEDFLDNHPEVHSLTDKEVKKRIGNYLNEKGMLRRFPKIKRPTLTAWWQLLLYLVMGIVLLPFIIMTILPIVLSYLIVLRIFELKETIQEEKYSELDETKELLSNEDKIIQNQMTHLVEIKSGSFRLFTLKLVLESIYLLARYYFNKGRLGNIETIHFARWVIIDNGKRLLFFSNYDGSWESYLSDFVDRASEGLTAVWSNTKGFPKAKFLLFKGARDEQRFKAWTRRNQVYTDVWYSSYRDLTVKNINNNTELNEGLFTSLSGEKLTDFLRKY